MINKTKTKTTDAEYSNDVMPAFKAYRKLMHKACGVNASHYTKLYTEKRAYGARTKYWLARETMPSITKYITKNPTFTAGGVVYKVHDEDQLSGYFQHSCRSIFCNKA